MEINIFTSWWCGDDKEMYKKVCCRAKLLLGSVVKLDKASAHTYNGDFGAIHIGYVFILFRIAFRVSTKTELSVKVRT